MAKPQKTEAQTADGAPDVVALKNVAQPMDPRQIAAVPGVDVACLELDLPKGVRGQHREDVARRQLRDNFGLDANAIQIRPFHDPKGADTWTKLLVADTALVDAWRTGHAASALAVLPDYLTLPTAEGVWTVGQGASGLAVRLGPFDGFGATAEMVPTLLTQALRETESLPRALLLVGPPLPDVEAVAAEYEVPVETDPSTLNAKILSHGEEAFDLRRDPQLARTRLASRVLPWRWPLGIGLVAAAIWAVAQIVITERIMDETRELRRQTQAMVQENFVPNAPILDVRVQVSQAISDARARAQGWSSRSDPIGLFAQSAEVLFAARAKVDEAKFSEAEGLQILVDMDNFAAVEALVDNLQAESLTVDLEEMRASDGTGVRASLSLSPLDVSTEAAQ